MRRQRIYVKIVRSVFNTFNKKHYVLDFKPVHKREKVECMRLASWICNLMYIVI